MELATGSSAGAGLHAGSAGRLLFLLATWLVGDAPAT